MRWTQNCRQTRWVDTAITAVSSPFEGRKTWDAQHTTICLSFQVMSMSKKKKMGVGGCYHFTTEEGKPTSSKTTKKWLGGCSHYSHTSQWVKTRLHWPWFHKHTRFSTGWSCTHTILRNLTLKIIPPRQGKITISHPYILLYSWSVRSTESYHGHTVQH